MNWPISTLKSSIDQEKANADADTLSRMPISFENYMESCSEGASQDVLDAVTSSIHETNAVQTAWLSSLTAVPDILKEECCNIPTMPPSELIAAQQEDPTIGRVLHFMQVGSRPTYQEGQKSQLLYDSSYMNGTNCSLLKMEFFATNLDLETEWSYPRNTTKRCMKNYTKTWGTWVQTE